MSIAVYKWEMLEIEAFWIGEPVGDDPTAMGYLIYDVQFSGIWCFPVTRM